MIYCYLPSAAELTLSCYSFKQAGSQCIRHERICSALP